MRRVISGRDLGPSRIGGIEADTLKLAGLWTARKCIQDAKPERQPSTLFRPLSLAS